MQLEERLKEKEITMNKIKSSFSGWITHHKKDLMIYFGYLLSLVTLIILAVAFQKTTPYSNLAIDIGFVQIAWYAVFILAGLMLGSTMAYFEFKRLGWNPDILFDGILIIAPLAILGARIYYVLFDPAGSPSSFIDVIAIWEGGLAIHGAIIVATIGVVILSRRKKINVWALADILGVALLMGQIAGRWGNFMNAEAHGPATSNALLIRVLPDFIKKQMAFSGSSQLTAGLIYHPTFLYESFANLVGLTILMILRRKRILKEGDTIGLYLIWYGLVRGILIEPLRTDQLIMFGLPVNIVLSLVLFVGGGILMLVLKRYFRKDESYYFDLLKENELERN